MFLVKGHNNNLADISHLDENELFDRLMNEEKAREKHQAKEDKILLAEETRKYAEAMDKLNDEDADDRTELIDQSAFDDDLDKPDDRQDDVEDILAAAKDGQAQVRKMKDLQYSKYADGNHLAS